MAVRTDCLHKVTLRVSAFADFLHFFVLFVPFLPTYCCNGFQNELLSMGFLCGFGCGSVLWLFGERYLSEFCFSFVLILTLLVH